MQPGTILPIRRRHALMIHFLIWLEAWCLGGESQQRFNRIPSSSGETFFYQFVDAQKKTNTAQFHLGKPAIQVAKLGLPTPAAVQDAMNQLMLEANQMIRPLVEEKTRELSRGLREGVRLTSTTNSSGGFHIEIQSSAKFTTAEIATVNRQNQLAIKSLQRFIQDLTSENPVLVKALLQRGITNRQAHFQELKAAWFAEAGLTESSVKPGTYLPDYTRICRSYAAWLKPVATALAKPGEDERAYVARALAFYQSIPYDTLGTGNDSDGDMGYLTPLASLLLNRGDCDTKSVALAATLRARYSTTPCLLVLVTSHALLGVNLPVAAGEAYLDYQGRRYLLMEPAGPRVAPPGLISEKSAAALRSQKFRQLLPLQ